ncbi:MAG: hypothetical protein JSV44_04455, partial [Candidatus Zixiibacteriota bacterium]
MQHIKWLRPPILCGLLLTIYVIPPGAAAEDEDGILMIVASDPQFYCIEMPKDSAILRNQLVANAWNNITELGRWPGQDGSKLIHGYDSAIIDPSGVIVNGDLTQCFMRSTHQAFIEWRNSINWDMYPGLGNHDVLARGYYITLVFGLLNLGFGDYDRSRKEAMWWMANLIEKEVIPNIVNRDIRGFVGLQNDLFSLRYDAVRIGIRYWVPVGSGDDSMLVFTWSERIEGEALWLSRWGFLRIPDKAESVHIDCHNFYRDEWVPVRSFPAPEPWQAQCYRVYSTLAGPKAETRSRPREWPDGNIGSLAYSYDIGPYYHFVQLHRTPYCEADLPSRWIPLARSNKDDAFKWDRSPALEWESSFEWLKEDLTAATEAGKYIVINYHGTDMGSEDIGTLKFREAIKDRNVV